MDENNGAKRVLPSSPGPATMDDGLSSDPLLATATPEATLSPELQQELARRMEEFKREFISKKGMSGISTETLAKNDKLVIVFGSINQDLFADLASDGIPPAGQNTPSDSFTSLPGGKGSNEAVWLAQLGQTTIMVGCIGSDDFGTACKDAMDAKGVNTTYVRKVDDKLTGVGLVLTAKKEKTVVTTSGANNDVGAPEVACVKRIFNQVAEINRKRGEGKQLEVFFLCQFEVALESVRQAVEIARTNAATVIVKTSPPREPTDTVKSILTMADHIVTNEYEAPILLGKPRGYTIKTFGECNEIAREVMREFAEEGSGSKTIMIPFAQGIFGLTPDLRCYVVPTLPGSFVNAIGVADAATAGYVHALMEHKPIGERMIHAACCAIFCLQEKYAQVKTLTPETMRTSFANYKIGYMLTDAEKAGQGNLSPEDLHFMLKWQEVIPKNDAIKQDKLVEKILLNDSIAPNERKVRDFQGMLPAMQAFVIGSPFSLLTALKSQRYKDRPDYYGRTLLDRVTSSRPKTSTQLECVFLVCIHYLFRLAMQEQNDQKAATNPTNAFKHNRSTIKKVLELIFSEPKRGFSSDAEGGLSTALADDLRKRRCVDSPHYGSVTDVFVEACTYTLIDCVRTKESTVGHVPQLIDWMLSEKSTWTIIDHTFFTTPTDMKERNLLHAAVHANLKRIQSSFTKRARPIYVERVTPRLVRQQSIAGQTLYEDRRNTVAVDLTLSPSRSTSIVGEIHNDMMAEYQTRHGAPTSSDDAEGVGRSASSSVSFQRSATFSDQSESSFVADDHDDSESDSPLARMSTSGPNSQRVPQQQESIDREGRIDAWVKQIQGKCDEDNTIFHYAAMSPHPDSFATMLGAIQPFMSLIHNAMAMKNKQGKDVNNVCLDEEKVRNVKEALKAQYKTCDIFISYKHQDCDEFVANLVKRLRDEMGLSVWWDVDQIQRGESWQKEISFQVNHCALFIPIVSKKYLQSVHCQFELGKACGRFDTPILTVLPPTQRGDLDELIEAFPAAGHLQGITFEPNMADEQFHNNLAKIKECTYDQRERSRQGRLDSFIADLDIKPTPLPDTPYIAILRAVGGEFSKKLEAMLRKRFQGTECRVWDVQHILNDGHALKSSSCLAAVVVIEFSEKSANRDRHLSNLVKLREKYAGKKFFFVPYTKVQVDGEDYALRLSCNTESTIVPIIDFTSSTNPEALEHDLEFKVPLQTLQDLLQGEMDALSDRRGKLSSSPTITESDDEAVEGNGKSKGKWKGGRTADSNVADDDNDDDDDDDDSDAEGDGMGVV